MQKLKDNYNRFIDYLRVSITDRCNLKCIYCEASPPFKKLDHKDILTYEKILRIVKIGVKMGISKVRITGGEPLIRKGVYDFLPKLTAISGLKDVSLTTNGVELSENAYKIRDAGIKRINISLDTLNRKKFKKITGMDLFIKVCDGIMSAEKAGFNPIKINVVALDKINTDELANIASLTFSHPFHIRFIEYMPIGKYVFNSQKLLTPEIKKHITSLGKLLPVRSRGSDGPAERFRFKKAKGEIGFISPLSSHFCNACNRMRLTSSGSLMPCLLSDAQINIKKYLNRNASDSEIAEIFKQAVKLKPAGHSLNVVERVTGRMSAIGG